MIFINGLRVRVGNEFVNGAKIPDPYNPLDLPPNTVRVRTNDGNAPIKTGGASYETATLVTGTTDVYDVYKSGTSFYNLFENSSNLIEVLGANTKNVTDMTSLFHRTSLTKVVLFDTSSVTDMSFMFYGCSLLTSVPLFDTSNVTRIHEMFDGCSSLTNVPLFDTSNVTDMDWAFKDCTSLTYIPLFDTSKVEQMAYMFFNCVNVQSGALALYQQVSTLATLPIHYYTFYNCGRDTQTGAAELAQIPSDWK